jgi:putative component of membrane protein insertase Oxa1/YidC/SpoIIIJ protein YidD
VKIASGLLLVVLASSQVQAEWDPWGFSASNESSPDASLSDAVSPQDLLFGVLFDVYRGFISPVNGSNCPMYPSCSRFARLAIDEFGPARGFLAAMDRLHRCGHDLYYYELVFDSGRWLRYDPPSLQR